MRIVLVVHGYPPDGQTGVEIHVDALARALARRGLDVAVFAPRFDLHAPRLSLRREARDGYTLYALNVRDDGATRASRADPEGAEWVFDALLEELRPSVVHVHHVAKLGLGMLEVIARRKLASVFTAHDSFAFCHRTVQSRPDLSRCDSMLDAAACARCDEAVGFLDGLQRFDDYQVGVLPDALAPSEREELARRLTQPASDERVARRAAADRRRHEAFRAIDRVLVPSQFLRERCIAAGFDAKRISHDEYGVDPATLAALGALPAPREQGALRVGYFGGASAHKGLHVLLAAFEARGGEWELEFHADSSDVQYVSALRARARACGARWRGAYSRDELAERMAGVDLVVVPSIWWENAPFVIREAFAAGRAVVASDTPALRESVRDGVDGQLFPVGDARALAARLDALAAQPELRRALEDGIVRPRALDDQVDLLIAIYGEAVAERAPRVDPATPASAIALANDCMALDRLSLDELARRCELGLAVRADRASLAVELLGDARRELAWRRRTEAARADLDRTRIERLQRALDDLRAEAQRCAVDRDAAIEGLAGAKRELDATARQIAALEQSAAQSASAWSAEREAHAATRRAFDARGAELDRARSDAESARAAHAKLHGERDSLVEQLEQAMRREAAAAAASSATVLALTQAQRHLRELERSHGELASAFAALERHSTWVESEAAALAQRLGSAEEFLRTPEHFQSVHAALARLEAELAWRRGEMTALRGEGGAVIRALVARSALGRRLETWERKP